MTRIRPREYAGACCRRDPPDVAGIDPRLAARQLVAVMDGAQLQWLLDETGIEMVELVRTHLEGQLTVAL